MRFDSSSIRPGRSGPRSLAAGALVLLLTLLPAFTALAQISTAPLRAQISKNLPKDATLAVSITALGHAGRSAPARSLLTHRADAPMIPASNLKLLTTASAVDRLGGDFHFSTRLLARRLADGTVEVAVVGDGDPSFGDAELFRKFDAWTPRSVFEIWAKRLSAAGITEIDRLVLDDSVFDEETVQPNWPENQLHRDYEAQVSGLSLNINCVDIYLQRGSSSRMNYRLDPPTAYVDVENSCVRGSKNAVWLSRASGANRIILNGQTNASRQGPMRVTIEDPTAYFGTVLAETFAEQGVAVRETVRDRTVRAVIDGMPLPTESRAQGDDPSGDAWDDLAGMAGPDVDAETDVETDVTDLPATSLDTTPWQLVAAHETPIATVLGRTNKDSVNLYAEALAKRMAFEATGRPGSWSAAEGEVKRYLESLGVDASPIVLDDGSGLSRLNRVTASAMTGVLAANFASENFDDFLASLSEAGADGTLQKRFRTSDRSHLHGRVFGKTGYINNVSTFSGYLHGRDGQWYAFSVLVNDCSRDKIWQAKLLQENLILELDKQLPKRN